MYFSFADPIRKFVVLIEALLMPNPELHNKLLYLIDLFVGTQYFDKCEECKVLRQRF